VTFIPYKPHPLHKVIYNHPLVPLVSEILEKAGISYYDPYFHFLEKAKTKKLLNPIDNHFSREGHSVFARTFVNLNFRKQTKNFYNSNLPKP